MYPFAGNVASTTVFRAAYFGGWYDAVVSRFLDFLFGFPALIFIVERILTHLR